MPTGENLGLITINWLGAPIAQKVTCWPTDLAASDSRPAIGGNLFNLNGLPFHNSFSLSNDMIDVLMKRA